MYKEYVEDCVTKVGAGKQLTLNETQSTLLQGFAAGAIDSGHVLALLKKDIFRYGQMHITEGVSVPETVLPLELDESMHVALRGILGMSGELADIMENVYLWFQGNELDSEKLKEDLGDLTFYASLLIYVLNTDWDEVIEKNKRKTDDLHHLNV